MRKGNIIAGILCGALSIYVIITCLGYPTAEAYGTGVPGPGLWPGIIAALLLVCSVFLIVSSLVKKKEDFEELSMWNEGTRRVYLSMAILVVYVAVLSVVGFILSSAVMLFVFVQWFSKMKIWKSLLISVIVTLAIYFIFKLVLNVPVGFGLFYL